MDIQTYAAIFEITIVVVKPTHTFSPNISPNVVEIESSAPCCDAGDTHCFASIHGKSQNKYCNPNPKLNTSIRNLLYPTMSFNGFNQVGGRLTQYDIANVPSMLQTNPGFIIDPNNYNSFNYYAVLQHIPMQRTYHQCASHDYRANQMVKHAFEDGHMSLAQLNRHTNRMDQMSSRDAFHYAKQHLNFK
jgi:hypothetical protein